MEQFFVERFLNRSICMDEFVNALLNRAFVAQVHSRGSPFNELSPAWEGNLHQFFSALVDYWDIGLQHKGVS